jgi:tetratricopeptide (TPR) repeat protein
MITRGPFSVGALALALCLSMWGTALAERTASPSEVALARQQFTQGVAAAREGAWEQALSAFESSYALYPNPQTLFNVAGARRQLGRLVGAAEAYRRYLLAPESETDAEHRAQAHQALEEIEPHLATATLDVQGLRERDVVRLDGTDLSPRALQAPLPIDPGVHELSVARGGEIAASKRFEAQAGGAVSVALVLPEDEAPAQASVATPSEAARAASAETDRRPTEVEQGPSRRLVKNPWLWTGVGAVLAAGAVALVMLWPEPQAPYSGNVEPYEVEVR